jgi:hypothetical protein
MQTMWRCFISLFLRNKKEFWNERIKVKKIKTKGDQKEKA